MTQTSQTRKDVKNSEYNVDLLAQQKQALSVQLKTLELQRGRMVLKASTDGKVARIVPKMGEIVSTGQRAPLLKPISYTTIFMWARIPYHSLKLGEM